MRLGCVGLAFVPWFLAAMVALVAMTGCAPRPTDAQAEQLAQARADIIAARLCADADARSMLYRAAGARLMAGLANLDLPAPLTSASAMVASDGTPDVAKVQDESDKAKEAEADPPAGFMGAILASAGGIALAALTYLRFSPGAFGLLANLAHGLLAPRATRDMRAAQAKAMDVAEQAVAYGHAVTEAAHAAGLKTTVDSIQASAGEAQDRLGIRPQVQAILAGVKRNRARRAATVPPEAT